MKTKLTIIFALISINSLIFGQFSSAINKDDVRTFLMVQGIYDYAELEVKTNHLYNSYLDKNSYSFTDLLFSTGLSALSGIGQGAYESNTFGYKQSDWLPKPLQDWYNNSQASSSHMEPDYGIFSWQFVFREVDYIADRAAYDKWMRFFGNKWWWSMLAHFAVKNTAATILRDTMKHDQPFYSFKLDLVFGLNN